MDLLSQFDLQKIDDRDLSQGEIKFENKSGIDINNFNYPIEYMLCYLKEKQLRQPHHNDNLINITSEKIHTNHSKICCFNNVNCITTIDFDTMNQDNFLFGTKFASYSEEFRVNLSDDEIYRSLVASTYGRNLKVKTDRKFIDILDYVEDDNINFKEKANNEIKELTSKYKQNIANRILISKMDFLALLPKTIFKEYSQYVIIAGGFAFSYYCYRNYGYIPKFEDIDFFICIPKEKENRKEILKRIIELFQHFTAHINSSCKNDVNGHEISFDTYQNDNVIVGSLTPSEITTKGYKVFKHPNDIVFLSKGIKFQIIKRLYVSPSECIHGFDVDSSCVLINDKTNILCTGRFYNAVKHGYNVVNFEKMSPSYEYRLFKNFKRGLAIWIPFIDIVKKNLNLHNIVDKSDLIIRKKYGLCRLNSLFRILLYNTLNNNHMKQKNIHINENDFDKFSSGYINDYEKNLDKNEYFNDTTVTNIAQSFKEINPTEQISNTFHKLVLNKYSEWYYSEKEKKYQLDPDIIYGENRNQIVRITYLEKPTKIKASNIIQKTSVTSSFLVSLINKVFIKIIERLFPDVIIFGNIVVTAFYDITDFYSKKEIYLSFKDAPSEKEKIERIIFIYKVYIIVKACVNLIPNEFFEEIMMTLNYNEIVNSLIGDFINIQRSDKIVVEYGNNLDDFLRRNITKPSHNFNGIVCKHDIMLKQCLTDMHNYKNDKIINNYLIMFIKSDLLKIPNFSFNNNDIEKCNLSINIVDRNNINIDSFCEKIKIPTLFCYRGNLYASRVSNYLLNFSILHRSDYLITETDIWRYLIPSKDEDKDNENIEFFDNSQAINDIESEQQNYPEINYDVFTHLDKKLPLSYTGKFREMNIDYGLYALDKYPTKNLSKYYIHNILQIMFNKKNQQFFKVDNINNIRFKFVSLINDNLLKIYDENEDKFYDILLYENLLLERDEFKTNTLSVPFQLPGFPTMPNNIFTPNPNGPIIPHISF